MQSLHMATHGVIGQEDEFCVERPMAFVTAEISVERDGKALHVVSVGPQSLFFGRGPDNDVVLPDALVSKRHMVLFFSDGGAKLMMRDLGSTNGSQLNGERVVGEVELRDGDRVSLGGAVDLSVRLSCHGERSPLRPYPSLLADLTTGVSHPIRRDLTYVGRSERCHIRFPDATEETCCIALHETGEIHVSTARDEFQVAVGEPFQLAGHQLVLRCAQAELAMRVWLSITPPCTCSIRQHGRTLGLCRSLHLRWTGSRARDRSPFEQASRRGSYIPLDRGGVFQVVRGRPYGNINHQYQPNRSRMPAWGRGR